MILTLMLALGLNDWVKSSWFISNLKQPTLHCQIKCLIWACPDWCLYFTLIGKKHHVFTPFFLSCFLSLSSDHLSVCLSIAVPQTVHEWQVSPQRLWPVCVRWSGLVEQCVQRSSSTPFCFASPDSAATYCQMASTDDWQKSLSTVDRSATVCGGEGDMESACKSCAQCSRVPHLRSMWAKWHVYEIYALKWLNN